MSTMNKIETYLVTDEDKYNAEFGKAVSIKTKGNIELGDVLDESVFSDPIADWEYTHGEREFYKIDDFIAEYIAYGKTILVSQIKNNGNGKSPIEKFSAVDENGNKHSHEYIVSNFIGIVEKYIKTPLFKDGDFTAKYIEDGMKLAVYENIDGKNVKIKEFSVVDKNGNKYSNEYTNEYFRTVVYCRMSNIQEIFNKYEREGRVDDVIQMWRDECGNTPVRDTATLSM